MKFTEETFEQAVIKLFEAEQIPHCNGMFVHKKIRGRLNVDCLKLDTKLFRTCLLKKIY